MSLADAALDIAMGAGTGRLLGGAHGAALLARLSPHAFGMAVNEVVPGNFAAIVGRLVDDPELELRGLLVAGGKHVADHRLGLQRVVRLGFGQHLQRCRLRRSLVHRPQPAVDQQGRLGRAAEARPL